MTKKMKRISVFGLVLVMILAWMGFDFVTQDKIKKVQKRPEHKINVDIDSVLFDLENNLEPNFEIINSTMDWVDARYDASDFRLQSTTRILFEHADKVPEAYLNRMKDTILGFKYWMDQPGEDSMCFWSENHQLMFATSEYLFGHYYDGEIFTNDGLTAAEHKEMGKERILIWLEQRWLYGFTEYYSNTYYVEDIAPLSNLIDYAPDKEIRDKSRIILDLLLYDLATQSYKGTFTSTAGRMYAHGAMHPDGQSMGGVSESIWDYKVGKGKQGMDYNFIFINDYEVPSVLVDIGYDESEVISKTTNGLRLDELKERDLIGTSDNQIMMQWGMEAFTNPEIITNSMKYIEKNNMLSNHFLNDFKMINITLLREANLLPLVSNILNPVTNGVAIQRSNVYTYKNSDFFMSTAQAHFPGEFADQQHVFTTTLAPNIAVFHTHPAGPLHEKSLSGSPGYWVGYGRFPHSVQDRNVNLSIYSLPNKLGFMEKHLSYFTHAYFPTELFDEYLIEDNYAFGKINDTYIALIGNSDFYFGKDLVDPSITNTYDLIQDGINTFWITEVSSSNMDSSFEHFISRIKSNKVEFNEDTLKLTYKSNREFDLVYKGNFKVNGEVIDTEYQRIDSPYANIQNEPDTIYIEFNGKSLFLDFYNIERIIK